MQEIEFGLTCPTALGALCGRKRSDILNGESDLGDVFLDQYFCSSICSVEQFGSGDVAQIPDQAGSQKIDQAENVLLFPRMNDRFPPFMYQSKVVIFARGILAPQIGM